MPSLSLSFLSPLLFSLSPSTPIFLSLSLSSAGSLGGTQRDISPITFDRGQKGSGTPKLRSSIFRSTCENWLVTIYRLWPLHSKFSHTSGMHYTVQVCHEYT